MMLGRRRKAAILNQRWFWPCSTAFNAQDAKDARQA
jgi:hypothetical protein